MRRAWRRRKRRARICPEQLHSHQRQSNPSFFKDISLIPPPQLHPRSATRLSAAGVADHMVTQMLRQGDAEVFKLYSQAKLSMMREALAKMDRQANERGISSTQRAS
jgi:hypothetical protein